MTVLIQSDCASVPAADVKVIVALGLTVIVPEAESGPHPPTGLIV
jgi:hypothetical protein